MCFEMLVIRPADPTLFIYSSKPFCSRTFSSQLRDVVCVCEYMSAVFVGGSVCVCC